MSKIQTTWRKMRPAAFAAALCGLGAVTDAQATLIISYSVSANGGPVSTFTCIDNAACDTDPTVGIINLGTINPIAGLLVTGSTQTSTKGPINRITSGSATVDWNGGFVGSYVDVHASIGDTNFMGPSVVAFTTGSGTFTTALGSTIDLSWWNDPANAQGGESPLDRPGNQVDAFSFTSTQALLDSFSHNGGPFTVSDPALFGMTLGFDFHMIQSSPGISAQLTSRGMSEIKPLSVPEPGTLALLGLGLVGLATLRRRRQ